MSIERIREALAAGPTPGPWHVDQDRRPGMAWNRHIYHGADLAICFMAHSNGKDPRGDEANARLIAACHPEAIRELLAEHDEDQKVIAVWRGRTERAEAELDDLRDMLLRKGFVECDIPACNCGSWHHRYGLPERMQEIRDALAEAGHELSNANGNLTLNALKELVAERDALKVDAERLRAERDELARQFEPMGEPTSPDELIARLHAECAEDEAIKRDARRYRWLRGREDGRYMTVYAFRTDIDEVCLGDELDAAIDAAMELTRPAEES